jgi:RNA polymerase sigma factor (sigma-70 family)
MRRDHLRVPPPAPAPEAGEGGSSHGGAESERVWRAVEAGRAGDAGPIDEIVAGLAPPLVRAVRALLGPRSPDLEDVVQDTLLAVVQALPSFRCDSTLLHFAVRIAARRATFTRRRSRSILGWLEQLWHRERPLLSGPATPRDETIADRRRRLLRALVGELPDTQADALVLRVALGHSIEEVAAITRAPVNTVRSRLRLAKEALRHRIEADPLCAELWDLEP